MTHQQQLIGACLLVIAYVFFTAIDSYLYSLSTRKMSSYDRWMTYIPGMGFWRYFRRKR